MKTKSSKIKVRILGNEVELEKKEWWKVEFFATGEFIKGLMPSDKPYRKGLIAEVAIYHIKDYIKYSLRPLSNKVNKE